MTSDHVDVLIVGAGLSGIAAACHLQAQRPDRSYAIAEARDAIGGTWDLFRYPGVRSDSDMFTLGFSFKPWEDARPIADGPAIRAYVRDTAREFGVDQRIRFGHRVVRSSWSSEDARWTVELETADGPAQITAGFVFNCTGYYRYDRGYEPELPGAERFGGRMVHPQQWTEDIDYAGKRVVVIGSGATAVTLVPAMAGEAAHVTMLQRTPSYVMSLPETDPVATVLQRVVPMRLAHAITRWKNVLIASALYRSSKRWPDRVGRLLKRDAARRLPDGFDVERHFSPPYGPWDQRLCLVPHGDLFEALSAGGASVVTDRIRTFTETGIELESGATLEADLVITATGLELLPFGGAELVIDGERVELFERLTYKGCMVSGVPNFAAAFGYTNASWTLKCELICRYVCRLLGHMDERGADAAIPTPGPDDVPVAPFISDLTSGYVQRAMGRWPRQGARDPWRAHQNYQADRRLLLQGPLDDHMTFSRAGDRQAEPVAQLAA